MDIPGDRQTPVRSAPTGPHRDREGQVQSLLAPLRVLPSTPPLAGRVRWTADVPGAPLVHSWGDADELLARCRSFGAAVGALHAHPVDHGAPMAPRPWILAPDDLPAMPGAEPVLEVLDDVQVRAVLQQAADCWTPSTWIHGDLTSANVLVADPDGEGEPEVWLVDLRAAGIGDPAWDLSVALDTLGQAATSWGIPPGAAFAAFGPAYRAAGGPAGPDAAWRCARALARAWSLATRLDGHTTEGTGDAEEGWADAAGPDAQVMALIGQARAAARRATGSGS